jgi:hypothetical protein
MALELHVFLRKQDVPDRQEWQDVIQTIKLPFELDPTMDLSRDTGFSPSKLKGEDSGFEIYPGPAENFLSSYPRLKKVIGDRDYVISFRWG